MFNIKTMICAAVLALPTWAFAQEFSALARVDAGESVLVDKGDSVEMTLTLTQGVPYRIFNLNDPSRLVIDFNEVDWSGLAVGPFYQSDHVTGLRMGAFRPGWSRMVLDLAAPMLVSSAAMTFGDDAAATLKLMIDPVDQVEFDARAGTPAGVALLPQSAAELAPPKTRQTGERPLVVVLDPGHGGIDPGAESDGVIEAELMLHFARLLSETLLRSGGFEVVLTREDDSFVPLETRVSIARAAGADVFLSLHADALAEGRATGATIYTLSDRASDVASEKLAERHDRADLLAGIDLSQQDDVIATVLMDMARTETAPRADKLADALVSGLTDAVGLYKNPRASAGFSVLKAADIPSVLIELGFLSSPRDRKRLQDTDWQKNAAMGILIGLQKWAIQDAAEAQLLRK